jgi:CheY-like chemotaxis protein
MSVEPSESLSSLAKPITQADLLAAVARACPPPIVSARILLADDAEEMRGLVDAFLGDTHQIDWAPDGQAAFEMFKSGCYDVVVTDLDMPVMDGHQLVSAIRRWEHDCRRPATPIVVVSGDSQQTHDMPRHAIVITPDADIRPIVPAFLSARRDDVLALSRALAVRDYALIQRVGHRLKGSGRSYGFDGLTEIGGALERAAMMYKARDVERQIDTLSDYLARVEVAEIEALGPAR